MQQIQRYFRKAGKALARFFGRVKKGSPIDIAILVCAAALVIALIAILVMSLLPDAAPVDASSSAPSSSSVVDALAEVSGEVGVGDSILLCHKEVGQQRRHPLRWLLHPGSDEGHCRLR